VLVNGHEFYARRGDFLLDAALAAGIELPHDCRSGHCGTCLVRVKKGMTVCGEGGTQGMVHACQARVVTDLELAVEPVPESVITSAAVSGLRQLAADVVEARIGLTEPVSYLPGQYYKVQFRGYPARCFSPTMPMAGMPDEEALRFHIRRVPGGRVSSALGAEIQTGHPVKLMGPFGNAYLRPNLRNRLVLISSGTGFAPIWSIAEAALGEDLERRIVVVAAARDLQSFYMKPALRMMMDLRNVTIIPVVDKAPQQPAKGVRIGHATEFLPALRPDDIIYACGGPKMVDAAKEKAMAVGAEFYADPFIAQGGGQDNMVFKAVNRVTGLLPAMRGLSAPADRLRLAKPGAEDPGRRRAQPHA
jgi:NAD(P)H-flavin reductase